jgi:hypothetical protein
MNFEFHNHSNGNINNYFFISGANKPPKRNQLLTELLAKFIKPIWWMAKEFVWVLPVISDLLSHIHIIFS